MRVCALLFCLILPISLVAAQAATEDPGRAAFDKGVEAYNTALGTADRPLGPSDADLAKLRGALDPRMR